MVVGIAAATLGLWLIRGVKAYVTITTVLKIAGMLRKRAKVDEKLREAVRSGKHNLARRLIQSAAKIEADLVNIALRDKDKKMTKTRNQIYDFGELYKPMEEVKGALE